MSDKREWLEWYITGSLADDDTREPWPEATLVIEKEAYEAEKQRADRLEKENQKLKEALEKMVKPIDSTQSKGALIAHYTAIAFEVLK